MKRWLVGVGLMAGMTGAMAGESTNLAGWIEGNRAFSMDLYGHLSSSSDNLFYAPHSLQAALGMIYAGAGGETETQIRALLAPTLEPAQYQAAYRARREGLDGAGIEWVEANSLWPQSGYELRSSFLESVKEAYASKVVPLDYHQPAAAADEINAWVARKTRDRIPRLIEADMLSPATRLVLVNAVYFKGDWRTPFDETATRPGPFHRVSGPPIEAAMMHGMIPARYGKADGVTLLELPYTGSSMVMLFVLPDPDVGLEAVEKQLTDEQLRTWEKTLYRTEVRVQLPRFTFKSDYVMNDVLMAMGMTDAFGGRADFSKIAGAPGDLFLSAVVHQAFIEVNEKGTEAAAATGGAIRLTSAMPEPAPEFVADRPFLFFILDTAQRGVLFAGRLMNP